jgi:choline dehydrogenase-like flavoprotein
MHELLGKHWDVVVVGAGMGGAVVGYELAKSGKSVLFLEKGMPATKGANSDQTSNLLEDPVQRMKSGYWPDKITRSNGNSEDGEFFIPLGCGPGGSTRLYASQLERFLPIDFAPPIGGVETKNVNFINDGWPIKYSEFLENYRKAEKLFKVSGTQDELNLDPQLNLGIPQRLGGLDEKIFCSLVKAGLHPFRAHIACSFVEGCNGCGGRVCKKSCKNDAEKIALTPALKLHGSAILYECEVDKLNFEDGAIKSLDFSHENKSYKVNGKIFILAAGALNSPLILFRSGQNFSYDGLANSSGMVGRNLMWHASDFFAVRSKNKASYLPGALKALSINDFYLYKNQKLGTIQSVGVPVDYGYVQSYLVNRVQKLPKKYGRLIPKSLIKISAHLGATYFRNSSVFATIVEDFPYYENRVIFNKELPYKIIFNYNNSKELNIRSHELYKNIKKVLEGDYQVIKLSRGMNINYGHACGTLRFGRDPKTSVLNQYNRAHDVSNLYVVDASFFPTSGGTNPSLTIAANALRVADYINSTQ